MTQDMIQQREAGPLFFYSTSDAFGEFSNFHRSPIRLDGHTWPTVEHYFQAQKFVGTDEARVAEIRKANNPSIAARLGRSRKHPLRRDWESAKDSVMRKALAAKFATHADLADLLLSTGDRKLIEATTDDHYWGIGSSGTGKNKLGLLLQELRATLRAAQET